MGHVLPEFFFLLPFFVPCHFLDSPTSARCGPRLAHSFTGRLPTGDLLRTRNVLSSLEPTGENDSASPDVPYDSR